MSNSDIISFFSLLFSIMAVIFSVFVYLKDQKRNNQDQLFQEKLNSYKELMHIVKSTHAKFFDVVDYVQFYKGDKNQWKKKFLKYSGAYYGQAYEFKYCLSKNSFILQENILNKLQELEFSLIHFVTSSAHQDSEITFNAYDHIGYQIEEIEKLIKLDLNINNLNIGLEKRIR
ncbi:hypothetical protein [Sphingobacterium anhuiense]|uniref:Uncharacterized protein n=1 Tax=Sphingobacterium anhuiense TaxID=493780 RepID=A0ABW5YW15_9SPHI